MAGGVLADQRHHLGGADVESDDECLVAFAVHDGKPGMGNGEWGMGRRGNRGAVSGNRLKATAGAAGPVLCASAIPDSPFPFPCSSPQVSRSEEHKSELQSLMRISYAVSCLKTKTHSCHK